MSNDAYTVVKSVSENTDEGGYTVNSVIVTKKQAEQFEEILREVIAQDPTYDFTLEEDFIKNFLWKALSISNLITLLGYKYVLVMPSYRNGAVTSLYNRNRQDVRENIMSSLWPVVNQYFNQEPIVVMAFPDAHQSFSKTLCREFHVDERVSNNRFSFGDDTISIQYLEGDPEEDASAIMVGGFPMAEGETFSAADIKQDLINCTGTINCDLIDVYQPFADNRITGSTKDISEFATYINNTTILLDSSDRTPLMTSALPTLAATLQKQIKVY